MQKLSRKQVKETLSQVPLETLLLGTQSKDRTLTHKQKEFARQVVLTGNKSEAYRKAYSDKGSNRTQGNNAHTISKHTGVQLEIQAYQAAIEAAKHRTPAQLREFVIHQLTLHAMNEDINPAQRIKSLELLGKVSEVAAFTERKETTVINQSSDIKQRLMQMLTGGKVTDLSINSVVDMQSIDSPPSDDADSLMAELAAHPVDDTVDATPTHALPPDMAYGAAVVSTHTIPHSESIINSVPCSTQSVQVVDNIEDSDPTITC